MSGNLSEMQILWPHSGPTDSETLEVGPEIWAFHKPSDDSDAANV